MRRLIVRTPNWLGDAVMALPAIAAVRRHFADAALVVAGPASVAPLFEERTPAAPDEIVAVDRARELAHLRRLRADAVLLLPNSFGSAWIARRSGIPERWGYAASGRGWLLTRALRRPRRPVHQVRYYLDLVRALGIDAPDDPPRIQTTPETRARAERLLSSAGVPPDAKLVGFAPGAAYGFAKRWPPERVAAVAARLAQAHGATPAIVGVAADRDTGRAIESSLPPGVRIVNLIGRTDLRLLAGVVARCAAFVSNDSGAMHVAAALGVPVTAIFGPTDERVTAPAGDGHAIVCHDVFCRPCQLRDCPIDHRCMKRIGVEDVVTAVARNW